jgi:hypothetical protein
MLVTCAVALCRRRVPESLSAYLSRGVDVVSGSVLELVAESAAEEVSAC